MNHMGLLHKLIMGTFPWMANSCQNGMQISNSISNYLYHDTFNYSYTLNVPSLNIYERETYY